MELKVTTHVGLEYITQDVLLEREAARYVSDVISRSVINLRDEQVIAALHKLGWRKNSEDLLVVPVLPSQIDPLGQGTKLVSAADYLRLERTLNAEIKQRQVLEHELELANKELAVTARSFISRDELAQVAAQRNEAQKALGDINKNITEQMGYIGTPLQKVNSLLSREKDLRTDLFQYHRRVDAMQKELSRANDRLTKISELTSL